MLCYVVARVPGMPGVWYLSGVAGSLPVLTLSRPCALVLLLVSAGAVLRVPALVSCPVSGLMSFPFRRYKISPAG